MPEHAVSERSLVAFTMPSLGADMDEGTIVEWRVEPGTAVRRGEVVAVVETDKSDLDVEVFVDGVVRELLVPTGVRVPVGTVLAMIEPATASRRTRRGVTEPQSVLAREHESMGPAVPVAPVPSVPKGPDRPTPSVVSPVLRHLAEQLEVDVARILGTGAGGRVTRDDIERAARTPAPSTPEPASTPPDSGPQTQRHRATPRARRLVAARGLDLDALLAGHAGVLTGEQVLAATRMQAGSARRVDDTASTGDGSAGAEGRRDDAMRHAIARQMVRSWQEIPHFQVAHSIDVGCTLDALAEYNDGRGVDGRVLPAAVFVRAAARAAAAVPAVNGWWRDGRAVAADGVHVGLVVALRRGGLVAPVIHDADTKDLHTLMAEFRDLVTRARAGRLRASEMSGATFTVTQLGEHEVDTVVPIIHPPQLAILGLGAVAARPWVIDGQLCVRPVLRATLAADHRAVDGRTGSAYLLVLSRSLQEDFT